MSISQDTFPNSQESNYNALRVKDWEGFECLVRDPEGNSRRTHAQIQARGQLGGRDGTTTIVVDFTREECQRLSEVFALLAARPAKRNP